MVLELEKCCFCIDLKTGSLIIGYLNLVSNILCILFVVSCVLIPPTSSPTGDGVGGINTHDHTIYVGIGVGIKGGMNMLPNVKAELVAVTKIVLYWLLVFFIINLSFAIILVIGLLKDKTDFVTAYLIYTLIFTVLGAIAIIVFTAFPMGRRFVKIIFLCLVITGLFFWAPHVYFLIVIRSYWLEMDG